MRWLLALRGACPASPSHLQSGYPDFESLLSKFQPSAFKQSTRKFLDLTASKASQMHVLVPGFDLVKVFLALQMHQIQLIHQAEFFQKFNGAINRGAIDAGLPLAGNSRREAASRCWSAS